MVSLGTKWECESCGANFYDLGKQPACPACGETHKFLTPKPTSGTGTEDGGDRSRRPPRVFMSYAKEDLTLVQALAAELRRAAIDVWIDEEQLLPGQDWELEVKRAICDSQAVLACLSPRSVSKTGYVQKEIRIAFEEAQKKPEGAVYLIPVQLEPCTVPRLLHGFHWGEATPAGVQKIIRTLESIA